MPPGPRRRPRPDAPLRRHVRRRTGEALVIALPALALLVTLAVDLQREEAFLDRARTTEATVLAPDERPGPDLPAISYTVDGREFRTVLTVYGDPGLTTGDQLPVLYDPAEPASVRSAGSGGDAAGAAVPAAIAAVGLLVLAVVLLVRAVRRSRASRAALQEPAVALAYRLVEGYVLLRPTAAVGRAPATLAVPLLPYYRRTERIAELPPAGGVAQVHGAPHVGGWAVPVIDDVPLWPRRRVQAGEEVEPEALPPPGTGWLPA